jgi:hypothetical protein
MRSILSIAFLSAFLGIKAQNNMVVFSENGEKFFLVVNGVKQNLEAETNVKVTDLIQPQYKVKVVFEDKSKGVVDQNIYLMNGGEPVKNYEFVYGIKMTKKASYKIRPISAVSTSEVKADPSQTVVHYSTTEPTATNNNVISESNEVTTSTQVNNGGNVSINTNVNGNGGVNTTTSDGNGASMNTNVQITETKTQTNNGGANGANVGVNIGGMGVNININDNMGGMGNSTTVTSQTITTTTSSSSSGNVSTQQTTSSNSSASTSMSGPSKTKTTTSTKPKVDPLPGYTGAVGCAAPINATEFASVKKTIDTKTFEDSKIKIAKQVIDNNCLMSSQVKEIMMLFTFEETRLDLAKYAYGHTYDIGNYYKLNDAFKFEASIDELDEYIKSNKSTK